MTVSLYRDYTKNYDNYYLIVSIKDTTRELFTSWLNHKDFLVTYVLYVLCQILQINFRYGRVERIRVSRFVEKFHSRGASRSPTLEFCREPLAIFPTVSKWFIFEERTGYAREGPRRCSLGMRVSRSIENRIGLGIRSVNTLRGSCSENRYGC